MRSFIRSTASPTVTWEDVAEDTMEDIHRARREIRTYLESHYPTGLSVVGDPLKSLLVDAHTALTIAGIAIDGARGRAVPAALLPLIEGGQPS